MCNATTIAVVRLGGNAQRTSVEVDTAASCRAPGDISVNIILVIQSYTKFIRSVVELVTYVSVDFNVVL